MKLKNVKHGQRVVLKVDTERPKAGAEGTIVVNDMYIGTPHVWVHFDSDVGGWGDGYFEIPRGHGWTCEIKDLKRLK